MEKTGFGAGGDGLLKGEDTGQEMENLTLDSGGGLVDLLTDEDYEEMLPFLPEDIQGLWEKTRPFYEALVGGVFKSVEQAQRLRARYGGNGVLERLNFTLDGIKAQTKEVLGVFLKSEKFLLNLPREAKSEDLIDQHSAPGYLLSGHEPVTVYADVRDFMLMQGLDNPESFGDARYKIALKRHQFLVEV